ncbi:T9SS type A sorting domain-containing protein [bacterium]|nr:T9SS type A sorting domain-containing protein [bacterium]
MGGRRTFMGRKMPLAVGILLTIIITQHAQAVAPEILTSRTYTERGDFRALVLADTFSWPHETILGGTATQNLFQAYALKVDSAGDPIWTRMWGTTYRMYDLLWSQQGGTLAGYTSANSTLDYKFLQFNTTGSVTGSWDFGGNTTDDRGFAAAYYDSARLLIAGNTEPGINGEYDASLVMTDLEGNIEWAHSYPPVEVLVEISRSAPNTIWIYGTTELDTAHGVDFWMARCDSLGAVEEEFWFGGPHEEQLRAAQRFDSTLTVLVGTTRSFSADTTHTDIWIQATNDNGDSLWSGVFGGTENDAALTVQRVMDRDTGFVIGGYWSEQLLGTRNALLMKFDQDFDSVWAVVMNDTVNSSEIRDIEVDRGYRYHAAGVRFTDFPHGYYLVTASDPAAPIQHAPDPFNLFAPDDSAFLIGSSIFFSWEGSDDPDPGDDVAFALLIDSDTLFENPIAIGPLGQTQYTWPSPNGDMDRYWRVVASDQHNTLRVCNDRHRFFRKIMPDSTLHFSLAFPDSGSALPNPFSLFTWHPALDPDSADETVTYLLYFQVGDSITVINAQADTFANVNFVNHPFILESDTVTWWVIAQSSYPQMSRVSDQHWTFVNWNSPATNRGEIPSEFALHHAYPNPFNSETTLEFELPVSSLVTLDVFDVTGRLVTRLVESELSPGHYKAHWNGRGSSGPVASGLYLARLSSKSGVATAKLLLMK